MVLAGLTGTAAATYVTTSQVADCTDDGSETTCELKTVLGVAVSYGNSARLDIGTDMSNTDMPIPDAVKIDLEKAVPVYSYPLKYFHTVAYFPHEEVIKVPNAAVGIQSCIDSSTADNPDCGWTIMGGERVEDSQGFCSNKDLELITDTTGPYRGETFLKEVSSDVNSFSTAHCLRSGDLYYYGYEIGSPVVNYEVSVKLEHDSHEYDFMLSPTAPVFTSEEVPDDDPYPDELMSIKAELAGDIGFGPANPGLPELDNYILYIPGSPYTHEYVENYHLNMMLVPREEVSKYGGELDKVGVSFYAFRHLNGDVRVTRAGDGLHNQLYHKHNGDISKLEAVPTAEADYLINDKKDFSRSMDFKPGMSKILEYKHTSVSNSLVNLVIDAPVKVQVVETEVPGIIIDASVLPFSSLSREGTLTADIQNTSHNSNFSKTADYLVTVTECNANILDAIPPRAVTLAAGEQQSLEFNIHTLYNLDTTNSCTLRLQSPSGKLFDEVEVVFNTLKHTSKYSWELQQQNEGTGSSSSRVFVPGSSATDAAGK
ncbi:hypothetical protein ACFL43_01970 [Thermodesulfobacteriota bacterium]